MKKIMRMTNISLPGSRMFKDSDRDGVKNVFDCKPFDPNKQAWYHKAGKWVVKKTLYSEHAEKARAYISRKEKESEELRKIRREERRKQSLETAKFKEVERGKQQRSFIKGGGYKGAFRKTFVDIGRTIEKGTRPRATTPTYRYVKRKGKKGRRVRVQVRQEIRQPPRQPPKMPDISSIKIPGL